MVGPAKLENNDVFIWELLKVSKTSTLFYLRYSSSKVNNRSTKQVSKVSKHAGALRNAHGSKKERRYNT